MRFFKWFAKWIKSERTLGLLKKAGVAVVCLCIVSYAFFHVSSLFSEEISTIVSGPVTEQKTVTLSGYIFRDAEVISSDYSGAVDYNVKNGEKVAVSDKLATVYEQGSVINARESLLQLDEQIALLESVVNEGPSVSELSKKRAEASDAYYSMIKRMSEGDLSGIGADKQKLIESLDSVEYITGGAENIKKALAALKDMRNSIIGAGGESEDIVTKKSGYFYTAVDGYEGSFSASAAKNLNADGFLSLFEDPYVDVESQCSVGKMSYDSNWYFVSSLDSDDASALEEGARYTVEFSSSTHAEIRMTLERVLESSDGDKTVLVFSSNVLPSGFGFERRQSAGIITESVRGIYVPRSAIHREGADRVVYTIKGSVVSKRYLDIVYEGADYCIVRENVETGADGKIYLQSNELLAIKGSNLFDGRILD